MKVGKVYEFPSGQGSLEILERIKVILPDRRLLQYPWGMHICDYQQKRTPDGFKTWYAFGIARNEAQFVMTIFNISFPLSSL